MTNTRKWASTTISLYVPNQPTLSASEMDVHMFSSLLKSSALSPFPLSQLLTFYFGKKTKENKRTTASFYHLVSQATCLFSHKLCFHTCIKPNPLCVYQITYLSQTQERDPCDPHFFLLRINFLLNMGSFPRAHK